MLKNISKLFQKELTVRIKEFVNSVNSSIHPFIHYFFYIFISLMNNLVDTISYKYPPPRPPFHFVFNNKDFSKIYKRHSKENYAEFINQLVS